MGPAPMEICRNLEELAQVNRPMVFAAGVFDGVHRGHAAVLREAARAAGTLEAELGVLTFHPHPASVLRPSSAPPLLLTRAEKHALLAGHGVSLLLELAFTPEFAALSAREFVQSLWQVSGGQLRGICAGETWSFGHQREGDMAFLAACGRELDFAVLSVPPLLVEGEPVSSTRIRRAIAAGHLALAAECLGRPVSLTGVVQKGAQLGRSLGFPTANLSLPAVQLPPDGVYAVRVHRGNFIHHGVANLGLRPTLRENTPRRVFEVHLLDFAADLYGEELRVELWQHLRAEKQFANLPELRQQIQEDASQARAFLDQHPFKAAPSALG